jgi:ribosomal protein S18 acetylase RimI-like enzyme
MGHMTHVAIRRAQLADVQPLAALAAKTFIDTFGHLYPPDDLRAFLEDTQSVARYTEVLSDPDVAVWLADVDTYQAVGFVSAGRCKLPVPNMDPRAGEIRQLYVLRQFHNHGLGSRLLGAALAWLEERAFEPLYVGVWSQNVGAQRLYERYGFRKSGEYEFPVGKTRDHEFILERRLA